LGKQIVGRVGECLAESREPFNAPDGFGASLAAKLGPGLAFTPLDELEPCELQFRFGACPEEQAFSFAVNAIPFQNERRGGANDGSLRCATAGVSCAYYSHKCGESVKYMSMEQGDPWS